MPRQDAWSRDQFILALNLYLKLPFGKMHSRTPEIIHLASLIGRKANAVAMRLSNYAAVDPYHQQRGIKGLPGGIKQVKPIWDEFVSNRENLLFESERLLAELEHKSLERKFEDVLGDTNLLKGEDKMRIVKTRVNQSVFRQMVLINYKSKCAITSIDIPDLLLASHIVPWNANEQERLNPENGICLSPLYDRAFDKGYISITPRYRIELSQRLEEHHGKEFHKQYFSNLPSLTLAMPEKYLPRKEFLEYHREIIFKR